MTLRSVPFKLVLPATYLLLTGLFLGGIIITIAEGPNPFGFLFYVAIFPSTFVFDLLLPHSSVWSQVNGWISILFDVFVNLLFYFALGYLIDRLIRRQG
ncbi:MAG: hypothetical protein ABJA18_03450 [bacterium]